MMKGVTLFTFDNDERTDTFWHSSAHILEEIEMLSEHIDETLDKDVAEEGTEELTNQLTAFLNEQGPGRLLFHGETF
ncbi:hypothetical protein MKW98_030204 [Papaver atlanticum]|uniref:Uncharacterized protein n=1 Tax=Papaver atlanticum TaxID=357466 RepID=A0AAD4XI58_9MAGN|nr:hypothetical protein MKW98_030204 [Papaver atlanticum]